MSMLPPAMICAPGFTLPQTSTELFVRTSCPPRSVLFTTTICTASSSADDACTAAGSAGAFSAGTAASACTAASAGRFCALAALRRGLSTGRSAAPGMRLRVTLKMTPDSWKSLLSFSISSFESEPSIACMTVPRQKNPEPALSFARISFSMAAYVAPAAKSSCRPDFVPLILTISSLMVRVSFRTTNPVLRTILLLLLLLA